MNYFNESLSQLQNNVLVDIGLFSDFDDIKPVKQTSLLSNSNLKKKLQFGRNIKDEDDDEPMLNLENPTYEHNELEIVSDAHSSSCAENRESKSCAEEEEKSSAEEKHCHVIGKDWTLEKQRNATVWRKLITVLILCVVFMVAEIIGGIIAKSIAIQTDAAHMAADIAGFFFSIVAIYVSGKGFLFDHKLIKFYLL